jgi:hypothetical protein
MRPLLVCSVGLAFVFAGCGRSGGTQSKQAIKAAIEQHLQQRANVVYNNMTFEVQDVKFNGDRAEADARFRSKQAPEVTVNVHYLLKKVGDHWQVESSSAMGGMGGAHGMGGAAGTEGSPHGTPPPSQPEPEPSH